MKLLATTKFVIVSAVMLGAVNAVMFAPSKANAVTAPGVTCVDLKKKTNMNSSFSSGYKTVEFSLKNTVLPVCETTTVHYGSYVVPDSWDGNKFNQSATPQPLYNDASFTFEAGKVYSEKMSLTITTPLPCKNTQVDFYYGQRITEVVWGSTKADRGHQGRAYLTALVKKTADAPACNPGQGSDEPQVISSSVSLPVELPATGAVPAPLMASLAAFGTYLVALMVQESRRLTRNQ